MADLNWLDRTIGWLSPVRGAQRAQARAVMQAMLAYEGARRGRRTDGWSTGATSADAEISADQELLRDRARDLVRNNPHAAKGLAVIVSNKIGTGILCQAAGPNRRINRRIDDSWKRWADVCDVSRCHDLYGMQSLAERTRSEAGESLVRLYATAPAFDGDVPLRLQLLEPDFIDSSRNEAISEDHEIRQGIEYQGERPVAYWLFDSHPGDSSIVASIRRGYASRRVPASEVIHYFKPLRAGQRRGVTDFAPVMLRLRALDDYDDAEVMRKKIAACLAAWVTTPQGLPGATIGPTAQGTDGSREESWRPGMVGYLKPGESVTVADPRPSSDYSPFNSVQLHAVAAGLGVPYELLTGDLSQVTYTSHRGGLVQFRGMVEADQWQLTVPQLCRPIWEAFVGALGVLDGSVNPRTPAVYTPPRFGLLDPAKEIPAMVEAIQAGIDSYPNALRREGYDWREKLDEIEEFKREVDERGLTLTSDARTQQKVEPAKPAKKPTEDDDAEAA